MARCSECGEEKGKHAHPEYPGSDDKLCDFCLLNVLENQVDELSQDLQEAQEKLAEAEKRVDRIVKRREAKRVGGTTPTGTQT